MSFERLRELIEDYSQWGYEIEYDEPPSKQFHYVPSKDKIEALTLLDDLEQREKELMELVKRLPEEMDKVQSQKDYLIAIDNLTTDIEQFLAKETK